jgi:hypothetical protein
LNICSSLEDTSAPCKQCRDSAEALSAQLLDAPLYSCFGMLSGSTQQDICILVVTAILESGTMCTNISSLLPALTNSTDQFCALSGGLP